MAREPWRLCHGVAPSVPPLSYLEGVRPLGIRAIVEITNAYVVLHARSGACHLGGGGLDMGCTETGTTVSAGLRTDRHVEFLFCQSQIRCLTS